MAKIQNVSRGVEESGTECAKVNEKEAGVVQENQLSK